MVNTNFRRAAPVTFDWKDLGLFMVLDVESVGLHGEGFAVGYVVADSLGFEHVNAVLSCDPAAAKGEQENRDWVAAHVPHMTHTHATPREVRDAFWAEWLHWKQRGARLVADCAWPVEARFLMQCVDDAPREREWEGPYPLHDLASVFLAHGRDPLATSPRLPRETPAHHPLADARQSARLLIGALQRSAEAPYVVGENSPEETEFFWPGLSQAAPLAD